MKAALVRQHLDRFYRQPRSLQLAVSSKLAAVLSTGLAAAGLLLASPAFGQATPNSTPNQKQNLTCVTEGQRLICDVQRPGQAPKIMTFEQKPYVGKASKTVELTPVRRTALFNPELDGMLASGLLWVIYVILPITVSVAIWRYDQRAREQMVRRVQQVATLERIWQHPQAR